MPPDASIERLIAEADRKLRELSPNDTTPVTKPRALDLQMLKEPTLERHELYVSLIRTLRQETGPGSAQNLTQWAYTLYNYLYNILKEIRNSFAAQGSSLGTVIGRVHDWFHEHARKRTDQHFSGSSGNLEKSTTGPPPQTPLSARSSHAEDDLNVRNSDWASPAPALFNSSFRVSLNPRTRGAPDELNNSGDNDAVVTTAKDVGPQFTSTAAPLENRRAVVGNRAMLVEKTPSSTRLGRSPTPSDFNATEMPTGTAPPPSTLPGVRGVGYVDANKPGQFVEARDIAYNRRLHDAVRNVTPKPRSSATGGTVPQEQMVDTSGLRITSTSIPLSQAQHRSSHDDITASRSNLRTLRMPTRTAVPPSPLAESPHEMLSGYEMRNLSESMHRREAILHPRPPPLPPRSSMRQDPDLVPKRTTAPAQRTPLRFRASPDPTPYLLSSRAQQRPQTAPAAPVDPDAELADKDELWLHKRQRPQNDAQYVGQVRATVTDWARARARMEEESMRRLESARYASQTGVVQHTRWDPKDRTVFGVMPPSLKPEPAARGIVLSQPDHEPRPDEEDDDESHGATSDETSGDENAAGPNAAAGVMRAKTAPQAVKRGSSLNNTAPAVIPKLVVSTGPLLHARKDAAGRAANVALIREHGLMLSPYTNVAHEKPVSRLTFGSTLDHPGLMSPHPSTLCPDKPYGPRGERMADIMKAKMAKKKKKGAKPEKKKYVPMLKEKKKKPKPPPEHVPSLERTRQLEEMFHIQQAFADNDLHIEGSLIERALFLPEDRVYEACLRDLPRPGTGLMRDPSKIKAKKGRAGRPRTAATGGAATPRASRPVTAPAAVPEGSPSPPTAKRPARRGRKKAAAAAPPPNPSALPRPTTADAPAGAPGAAVLNASLRTGVRPTTSG